MSKVTTEKVDRIVELLHTFKLPTLAAELPVRFEKDAQSDALLLVLELLEMEAGDRRQRRVERLLRASKLPPGKSFETLLDKRLPRPLSQKLTELSSGEFLDRATNILAFGLPGTGKSHSACAVGHALIAKGHSVLFTPTCVFRRIRSLIPA